MILNGDSSMITKNDSQPFVSVVIPTYGREELLCKAIQSVLQQDYQKYEIIIVDQTPMHEQATEDYLKSLKGRIRYFKLEQTDLSKALNFGISKAIGGIIAFTEDDAQTAPTWLAELVRVMLSRNAHAVGGKVVPDWEIIPPRWFSERVQTFVSAFDLGQSERALSHGEIILSGNMLIKKEVMEAVGLYREDLGRKGNILLSNEEVDLCARLIERGYKIWWSPKAVVYHYVPKERLKRRWLIRRAFWQGISEYVMKARRREINAKTWIVVLLYFLGNTVMSPFSFLRFLYLIINIGFLAGSIYRGREKRNYSV